jgi:hypothetical protein
MGRSADADKIESNLNHCKSHFNHRHDRNNTAAVFSAEKSAREPALARRVNVSHQMGQSNGRPLKLV